MVIGGGCADSKQRIHPSKRQEELRHSTSWGLQAAGCWECWVCSAEEQWLHSRGTQQTPEQAAICPFGCQHGPGSLA